MIHNPVLRGFNPDPSICRVGDVYYMAVSTFQWFPGVRIYQSKDLVCWEHAAYALTRESQLSMLGTPDSTGVWAPCLSYSDGLFYLIFTNVRNRCRAMDVTNYLVTAPAVTGPWSEPIELNHSGFDPSLFHDEDGRKWLVNMRWGVREGENPFSGILLQEYSETEKKLVGPCRNIFRGTNIGLTEAPHLYRRDGWYYLMTAEGGTGYNHAVTLARSRNLFGPYEVHPQNPVLTSHGTELTECLQKAGHGSLTDTPDGRWYLAHLCGRPAPETDRCIMGRETAIQAVEWHDDDWLYLSSGGNHPQMDVPVPGVQTETPMLTVQHDTFDEPVLNPEWNTLRIPASERLLSLTARPGWLRLFGRESPQSTYEQSLVARRVQNFCYTAETEMEFQPTSILQMAGLICYYNTRNSYYLRVSWDEDHEAYCVGVLANVNGDCSGSVPQKENLLFTQNGRIGLRVQAGPRSLQFSCRLPGTAEWTPVGPVYDASTLSDDFAFGSDFEFTGAFVGLCCQDSMYGGIPADFDAFSYVENAEK